MARWRVVALGVSMIILSSVAMIDAQPDGAEGKVAYLVRLLRSSDEAERVWASGQIGNLRESAAAAVPALVANLSDDSGLVRAAACMALARLGAAATPAVPVLRTMLRRCDSDDVLYLTMALGDLSASIPDAQVAFLALLDDKCEDVRWHAVAWLAKNPFATAAVVPKLIRFLAPTEGEIMRWNAASALRFYGSGSAPATGSLSECLEADVDGVRCSAALALASIGESAVEALPALRRAASASAADVKAFSLFAIWKITGEESGAAAALAAALTGTIWEVPLLEALGQMGSLATPHVMKIAEMLGAEVPGVREAAAGALGRVPSESPAVATALSSALADQSYAVRAAATTSLATIAADKEVVIGLLARASADPNYMVRQAFCRGVLLLGVRASPLCERLIPLLHDAKTVELAVSALRNIGTERAVSALVEGSRRSGPMRPALLTALGEMGTAATSALPLLRSILDSAAATPEEREAAGKAIALIMAD